MDADAIDLSKENIQPLRQGRRAAQLGLALKAQSDKDVQDKMLKERDSYELAILTYEGDDPLSPRIDYVRWIEQCCPKYGPESNMIPLLEDTIMLFKDNERYKQDPRFVELIIKYIESQDNAPELYQIVHSEGIGTKCAILYKAWAECLDSCHNFKGADQIYTLGISNNAQPIDLLKEVHAQFQLSVARRMLLGVDTIPPPQVENGATERQRTVLGKITKKSASDSLRVARKGPGQMSTPFSDSRNNMKIHIFQEDENDNEGLMIGGKSNKLGFANKAELCKENIRKPQPWNQGFPKNQHRTVAPLPGPLIPTTPTFQVLKDDNWDEADAKESSEFSQPTPLTASKVLKTRKSEVQKTPIQLFKSPHVASARGNMPKFEVYTGGKEFSFEELRLAYYIKHQGDKNKNGCSLSFMKPDDENETPSTPHRNMAEISSAYVTSLPLVEEDEEESYNFKVYCD